MEGITTIRCMFCSVGIEFEGFPAIKYKEHFVGEHKILTYSTDILVRQTIRDQLPSYGLSDVEDKGVQTEILSTTSTSVQVDWLQIEANFDFDLPDRKESIWDYEDLSDSDWSAVNESINDELAPMLSPSPSGSDPDESKASFWKQRSISTGSVCLADFSPAFTPNGAERRGKRKKTTSTRTKTASSSSDDQQKRARVSIQKLDSVFVKEMLERNKASKQENVDCGAMSKQELGKFLDSTIEDEFSLAPSRRKVCLSQLELPSVQQRSPPKTSLSSSKSESPAKFSCRLCRHLSHSRNEFGLHMRSFHVPLKEREKCCGKLFTTRWSLLTHKEKIHKKGAAMKGSLSKPSTTVNRPSLPIKKNQKTKNGTKKSNKANPKKKIVCNKRKTNLRLSKADRPAQSRRLGITKRPPKSKEKRKPQPSSLNSSPLGGQLIYSTLHVKDCDDSILSDVDINNLLSDSEDDDLNTNGERNRKTRSSDRFNIPNGLKDTREHSPPKAGHLFDDQSLDRVEASCYAGDNDFEEEVPPAHVVWANACEYKCAICDSTSSPGFSSRSRSSFMRHIRTEHKLNRLAGYRLMAGKNTEPIHVAKSIVCSLCNRSVIQDAQRLSTHFRFQHKNFTLKDYFEQYILKKTASTGSTNLSELADGGSSDHNGDEKKSSVLKMRQTTVEKARKSTAKPGTDSSNKRSSTSSGGTQSTASTGEPSINTTADSGRPFAEDEADYRKWASQCRIDCRWDFCSFSTAAMDEFQKHLWSVHRQKSGDYCKYFNLNTEIQMCKPKSSGKRGQASGGLKSSGKSTEQADIPTDAQYIWNSFSYFTCEICNCEILQSAESAHDHMVNQHFVSGQEYYKLYVWRPNKHEKENKC